MWLFLALYSLQLLLCAVQALRIPWLARKVCLFLWLFLAPCFWLFGWLWGFGFFDLCVLPHLASPSTPFFVRTQGKFRLQRRRPGCTPAGEMFCMMVFLGLACCLRMLGLSLKGSLSLEALLFLNLLTSQCLLAVFAFLFTAWRGSILPGRKTNAL